LICLGWLIYQIKLIEKCMKECLNSNSILDYDDTFVSIEAIIDDISCSIDVSLF
ncbi:unnamed protein product, partial [Rotaria sp. Silwood2]